MSGTIKTCPNCGAKISSDEKICPVCGARQLFFTNEEVKKNTNHYDKEIKQKNWFELLKINDIRKRIIAAGLIIIILMGLFPPWLLIFSYSKVHSQKPVGYAFIATPYKLQSYQKLNNKRFASIKIDVFRLLLEWILVLLIMGLSILLTSNIDKKHDEINNLRE